MLHQWLGIFFRHAEILFQHRHHSHELHTALRDEQLVQQWLFDHNRKASMLGQIFKLTLLAGCA